MKRLTFFILCLVLFLPVFASSLSFTADLGCAQDFIIKTNSYQFSADARFKFADKYEVKLPVTFSYTNGAQFLDAGILLNYYPFKNYGLFFGLSLVQFGYINGNTELNKNIFSLNEINVGWTFKFFDGLIVEPGISIRDPSGTFEDEYELIKGVFQCYRKFRIKLNVGWSFDLKNWE